jgi:hypothetical protein
MLFKIWIQISSTVMAALSKVLQCKFPNRHCRLILPPIELTTSLQIRIPCNVTFHVTFAFDSVKENSSLKVSCHTSVCDKQTLINRCHKLFVAVFVRSAMNTKCGSLRSLSVWLQKSALSDKVGRHTGCLSPHTWNSLLCNRYPKRKTLINPDRITSIDSLAETDMDLGSGYGRNLRSTFLRSKRQGN